MRIAIVAGDDLVGDDAQQLCVALADRGHDATAYVRQPKRRSTRARAERGCRVVALRVGPRAATSGAALLPYVGDWAATLEREWSARRPDVVHAYGWLGGLAAQLAAGRRGIPTVQSFHGLAATSGECSRCAGERGRIEPLLARGAAWVTAESTADVDALARLRRSRGRISSLGSGVDVERFTPVGPADAKQGPHRVVSLGPDPRPVNGFDVVIRALPRVAGAELVVAETGRGAPDHDADRARLEGLAAELGVADRVRFAGAVDGAELPALLRSADLVACTPRRPPRATPVLQAMACGVAVVALPVGVLPDVVVDAVTGVVLRQHTPAALAAALRNLLPQSFQCDSMGAAGRSRAVSRFTWDRMALDALNIYRQAATLGSTTVSPAAHRAGTR
ncbi:glycosyltransferase [Mycobacterium palustre]|uniref:Glycosyl transferase family 1 n=1 Tax=Mycobacterium palustre TaxID=153971 RepID=A0A1X1ZSQ4_9MYCO|nr:glycosyltransferase [Mycobacterium palustre]MCV7099811.1 glycosyltransferase [Mycobacterium palustre]ORW26373.1 glycosyl transferase family 1 [Mycobacterium palustre]